MTPEQLMTPPTEIEIGELLIAVNTVPDMGDILRRLAFALTQEKSAHDQTRRERDVLADVLDKVLEGRLCWLRSEATAFIKVPSREVIEMGEDFIKRFVVFCQDRAALSGGSDD